MDERKAIIVGASGGIGSAVAIALAREDIASALVGRNREKLTEIAEACIEAGGDAFPLVCDISQTETIKGTVVEAIYKLGGLNTLVNCAGKSKRGKLHEADLDGDIALVLGNEDHGVSKTLLAASSQVAFAPQLGKVGSLNVSAVTAIGCHEWARRRWVALEHLVT